MNNVDIFQEFLGLIDRQNYSYADIAAMAGIKNKQSVSGWIVKRKIPKDEYLVNIADATDDMRFSLAVNCYLYHIPAIFLDLAGKYKQDSLSILIGTQVEDLGSDDAIKNMILEVSKSDPDISIISAGIKKMMVTCGMMFSASKDLSHKFGISIQQAVLER